jgi:HEAT repeat protein
MELPIGDFMFKRFMLRRALASGKDFLTKFDAAKKLAIMKDPRALEILILGLDQKDKDIRIAAVEALGSLGDPIAVESLIKVLADGNNGSIRISQSFSG